MLRRMLAIAIILTSLVSCASWFGSSQEDENNPAVGGRQDSSDMLFGQAESSAPMATGSVGGSADQPLQPATPIVVPATNASAAK